VVIVEQRFIAVNAKGKFFCSFALAKIGVVANRYEGSTSRSVYIPSSLVRPFDCAKLPMDCFEKLNEISFGVRSFEAIVRLIVNVVELSGVVLVMKLNDGRFCELLTLCEGTRSRCNQQRSEEKLFDSSYIHSNVVTRDNG